MTVRVRPSCCPAGHPPADPYAYRCPACGGPLECPDLPAFDPAAVEPGQWSLWRYAAMLPADRTVSLGEGGTPLVRVELPGGPVLAKLEFLSPTGSYKDRGTAVLVNHLLGQGVGTLIEDSSGNAGASLAAYAGAAGLRSRVYVPAHAAPAKKRQIAALGAEVVEVAGPRSAAGLAARRDRDGVYASHVWSPYFLAGQLTCAWEIWEQTGQRPPDVVVCPVGQGNLFLGLGRGFAALVAAGLLDRLPRMVAVQPAACAPLVPAWQAGSGVPAPVTEAATVAEGLRAANPVRGAELLRTIRATGGAAVEVADPAVLAAQRDLARTGIMVEPTSAVAVAALPEVRRRFGPDVSILVPLTGSGLKSLR